LPAIKGLCWIGKILFSFLTGYVILTIEGILFSLFHIHWSLWGFIIVPILFFIISIKFGRFEKKNEFFSFNYFSLFLIILGLFGITFAFIKGCGNSMDLLYFWGVKGLRFALSSGIDVKFLKNEFSIHTHINYPPLLPIQYAFSVLFAGKFCWKTAPLFSVLWLLIGSGLIYSILQYKRKDNNIATIGSAYWTLCMASSLIYSKSGGNAEAPLLVFVSIAVISILIEEEIGPQAIWISSISLAGAVLTKIEGSLFAVWIFFGILVRDWKLGVLKNLKHLLKIFGLSLLVVILWITFLVINNIPLQDPAREKFGNISFSHIDEILSSFFPNLNVGTYGFSWILPLISFWIKRKYLKKCIPALFVGFGSILFIFVYYLHLQNNVNAIIGWTLPRLIQPVLSVFIISAIVVLEEKN
jgi:hypothetical protein